MENAGQMPASAGALQGNCWGLKWVLCSVHLFRARGGEMEVFGLSEFGFFLAGIAFYDVFEYVCLLI